MKDLPIFFVAGLPRSGSTLIMNLFGQCPNHHVTPTNDLVELVLGVRNQWQSNISFKSQGLDIVEPRVRNAMKGLMQGFYTEEFEAGKNVFDKSRGWIAYIELLEEILQRPVKVIVTIRDVRAILSSFEKVHRKSSMTKTSPPGDAFYDVQTIDGRARQLLHIKSVVGLTISRFRDALDRGLRDKLILVPYHALTANTQDTMDSIHDKRGIERFKYDPTNVEQITHENDSVHGMKLHTIKNEVKFHEPDWEEILTPGVCSWIENEYADINSLSRSPIVT